jgi:cell division septum initiation protein DivIVA
MTVADETEFTVVRRGYNRAQVDGQIDMLSTQLHTAAAARESAVAEVQVLSRRLEAGVGEVEAARADSARRRSADARVHRRARGQRRPGEGPDDRVLHPARRRERTGRPGGEGDRPDRVEADRVEAVLPGQRDGRSSTAQRAGPAARLAAADARP